MPANRGPEGILQRIGFDEAALPPLSCPHCNQTLLSTLMIATSGPETVILDVGELAEESFSLTPLMEREEMRHKAKGVHADENGVGKVNTCPLRNDGDFAATMRG